MHPILKGSGGRTYCILSRQLTVKKGQNKHLLDTRIAAILTRMSSPGCAGLTEYCDRDDPALAA